MRSKLIELLTENFADFCKVELLSGNCVLKALTFDADKFADYLISHGVTFADDYLLAREQLRKEENYEP